MLFYNSILLNNKNSLEPFSHVTKRLTYAGDKAMTFNKHTGFLIC